MGCAAEKPQRNAKGAYLCATVLVQITMRAMGYDLRLRRSLCGKAAPFRSPPPIYATCFPPREGSAFPRRKKKIDFVRKGRAFPQSKRRSPPGPCLISKTLRQGVPVWGQHRWLREFLHFCLPEPDPYPDRPNHMSGKPTIHPSEDLRLCPSGRRYARNEGKLCAAGFHRRLSSGCPGPMRPPGWQFLRA
jgi:hypothetical protein